MKRITGRFETISTSGGETAKAFIPLPLPPSPPLQIDPATEALIARALVSLGRLDAVSTLLPETALFLYTYIRKEAVLSSQIEGTRSTLTDLLLFENETTPGVPVDDVQEVSNYVAAINHGLRRLKDGFPLSLRLIREVHGHLLKKGRGSAMSPGEFRTSQNWVGGSRPGNARYVPPPAHEVMRALGDLENFLHDKPVLTQPLIKAALSHVQFETIHPFLDGNGRVGRLLVTLLLCNEKVLKEPFLYLSLYFKANREEYYERLQQVREVGDWEGWLQFFVKGVHETAERAVQSVHGLQELFATDSNRLKDLKRTSSSALRVHRVLQSSPIASTSSISVQSGLSFPAVQHSLKRMEALGIVKPLERRTKSGTMYVYTNYLTILNEGLELD